MPSHPVCRGPQGDGKTPGCREGGEPVADCGPELGWGRV
ncbi:predicted protein [Plenodomus lingam JN3]|uniref:Predicted protein n=1 Tax=Leptosphaeria maculans (strain JN3 / isolate v23.1.3 / race Av1-4-5-6-7-8) TaxID=985895 RepID=E5A2D5_LEPMJ|nr:predicted protein [Plenodomus lingam JN3]CBX97570.1 predicted protein [Plenodomus lingam JN3]